MSDTFDLLINDGYSTSMILEEYLDDPNLSVSAMIAKYNVSTMDSEYKKTNRNLVCIVCGAKAIGYNFDQISCESCKAFFRRNALKDLNELHCRFSGHCKVNVESRRHCPYCRLQKCFQMGMRKEWIRTDEEKTHKRLELEKKRRRRAVEQPGEIPVLFQSILALSPTVSNSIDRVRLNNITHCYDQFTRDPSNLNYYPVFKLLELRLDEFFNRKKPIFINLISYFKHLPELQTLNMDDQVSLIKRNIRLIIPLNYAILKTSPNSAFGSTNIRTIGCVDDVDLHALFRSLSNTFIEFVQIDPILVKLLLIILFFSSSSLTTRSIYDPVQYNQRHTIQEIQASYVELLWNYLREKRGEVDAVHLYTKMITRYLHIQTVMNRIDSIVQANQTTDQIDSLMKTVLHLT